MRFGIGVAAAAAVRNRLTCSAGPPSNSHLLNTHRYQLKRASCIAPRGISLTFLRSVRFRLRNTVVAPEEASHRYGFDGIPAASEPTSSATDPEQQAIMAADYRLAL